jgi:ABC-type transport system involved in cytochrome c biogenesis permease subunit
MAYASFSPSVDSQIKPLIPALKSNWLIVHVITCSWDTPPLSWRRSSGS